MVYVLRAGMFLVELMGILICIGASLKMIEQWYARVVHILFEERRIFVEQMMNKAAASLVKEMVSSEMVKGVGGTKIN